jgi:hypothetical protein
MRALCQLAGVDIDRVMEDRLSQDERDRMAKMAITHANTLGIEMLIDYFPKPHGRAWRCDRQDWLVYKTKTVSGAPGGDWFHVEISPMMAQNASTVRKAWASVFPEIPR